MSKILAVALGGALGSLARYAVASLISSRYGARIPDATFAINISACFLIGFALTFFANRPHLNMVWRFLVPVGFIGAYSTFSTFEWEIFERLELGAFALAGLYTLASVAVGLVAVWLGAAAARLSL